jgi:hypothetical protein
MSIVTDKAFGIALAILAAACLLVAVGFRFSGRADRREQIVAARGEFSALYLVLAMLAAVGALYYL